MSPLRFLSSLCALLLLSSCGWLPGRTPQAVQQYFIHPDVQGRYTPDARMADYLRRHLESRSPASVLSPDGVEVAVHVGADIGGDFAFRRLPDGGYYLGAKDERTMTWLVYQFIKMAGKTDRTLVTDDLPPLILSGRDTVVTFPFEYTDLYMPTNQNPDMTYLLALNNLEMDWGIWGHNLSRVLGGNGESAFGYQNMDQELFARANGVVHQNQFCFSSDKLLELTEQYILDQYGDGSKVPYRMTIGPNDNGHVCLCRRCESAGNTPGNATPALVAFVERLAARFPLHTFFIPGYSTTSALPDHVLPSNVGVFLSAIDYPRAWDDAASPASQAFFELLEQWKHYTRKVYIWDYACNFDDYLSPYPILYVMQQRFREYRARGVQGIFLNGSGYFYSTQQEMYSFVLSALLINPDADIPRLVNAYFADAMPHVGPFYSAMVLQMEDEARKKGKELPLYGGIEEALDSYLDEKVFREQYSVFLHAQEMEMTHRERVLYQKTRQFVSFTFLEMCRKRGLGPGGFAEQIGDEWVVKPEVWAAVEDLKQLTDEDDIYLLTNNENASMDQIDRVNEAGVYIADYENEVELWLAGQMWMRDVLLHRDLPVRYEGGSELTSKLTDGVSGISQNYHWGWQIYPQQELQISLPADALAGKSGEFTLAFLNSERHRMSPPKAVEVWVDGRKTTALRREGITDYCDEGEKVIFRGATSFGHPETVELRFVPSHTRNLAIDEIYFR